MRRQKSIWQATWDFVGIPFRLVLFDQAWLPRFRWTTLEEERLNAVLPHVRGRLLDVGAGMNTLVNRYGNGVGVDVHEWGGGALVVADTSHLAFDDQSFDTITFVACLNHIPYRDAALREARRLIKPDGRLIITMINPVFGDVGHRIWWYSEDKHRGGMLPGEQGGLWTSTIVRLCEAAGFSLERHERFVYGLNNLYLLTPR
jgi:SAM-dependent methyltransferase